MRREYWMPYGVGPLLPPSSLPFRLTLTARADGGDRSRVWREPGCGTNRGY